MAAQRRSDTGVPAPTASSCRAAVLDRWIARAYQAMPELHFQRNAAKHHDGKVCFRRLVTRHGDRPTAVTSGLGHRSDNAVGLAFTGRCHDGAFVITEARVCRMRGRAAAARS